MKRLYFAAALAGVLFLGLQSAQAEIVQGELGGAPCFPIIGDGRLTPAFPDTVARNDVYVQEQHTREFDILR
ncbi:MAG: hypothetical protein QNK03_16615 [Myxococcota bacterium]|nr:hypothetical protein [Myxococcota bacterium]